MTIDVQETSVAAVELVEELTNEELKERHRLELKVERAFVEAGAALRQLRDKRLYRSTHKNFEEYCRDRFNFQRSHRNREGLRAQPKAVRRGKAGSRWGSTP